MIQIIPFEIKKETLQEKEKYLKSRGEKYQKIIFAGNPNRDKSKDEMHMQEYINHLLLVLEGEKVELSLESTPNSEVLKSVLTFKDQVENYFPLLEGEALMEEQIGHAFNGLYLKQVTSLATVYFTDSTLVGAPNIDYKVPALPKVPASNNAEEESESLRKVAKTALDIGKTLSKVVPSPYNAVLSGVFDGFKEYLSMGSASDAEKDTENTINRIAELVGKITWQANVEQTVKEQKGKIYGIIDGLNNHYGPLKLDSSSNYTSKELVDNYLTPYLRELDTVLNTLSLSDFDVASLPEYCLAASTYFCVLQELAVLDSNHQDDPFKSPHCKEITQLRVPSFTKYVNKTYDKLIQNAKDRVLETTEEPTWALRTFRKLNFCHLHDRAESDFHYDTFGGWYYDNPTFGSYPRGYFYCTECGHSTWAYDECYKAWKSWVASKQNSQVNRIKKEMDEFKKLANEEWAKLRTKPLYGSGK